MTTTKRVCISGVNEYDKSPRVYCENCELFLNKKGNWEVNRTPFLEYIKSRFKSTLFFHNFRDHKIIFNRDFECISHRPSAKYVHHKANVVCVEPF